MLLKLEVRENGAQSWSIIMSFLPKSLSATRPLLAHSSTILLDSMIGRDSSV